MNEHTRNETKKKKGSGMIIKLSIFLGIIFAVFITVFVIYREGSLPKNPSDTTSVIFTIEPGEPLQDVIKKLESENLIRNRLVFYSIVRMNGIDKKIQAGKFRLSPSMDAKTLAEELTHGTNDTWVTIIEGLRKEEIAEEISRNLDIPAIEISALAEEGYLFPDTYLFPQQISAEEVVRTMKSNYREKVTPEIVQNAKERGLTEEELVTLASLVEREANSPESREEVASILLRRLEEEMPLQVDATVQFVIGYYAPQKRWWKKGLTFDDLEIDSPYNTYANPGLPPGPIASPSLSSIIAVSQANSDTPYLFYITGNDGRTYYGRNLEEHNRNIERHLN